MATKRKTASVKRGMWHVLAFLDAQQAAGDASELFDGLDHGSEQDIDAAISWIRSQFSSDTGANK